VSEVRAHLAVALIGAGLAGYVLWRGAAAPERPVVAAAERRELLELAPRASRLAITVDVRALRATALGRALFASGRDLGALGKLDALCGRDPSESIEELLVVASGDGRGDVGLAVRSAASGHEIADCAVKVLSTRGASPTRAPRGRYTVVRAPGRADLGELAVRDDGVVLLAGGSVFGDLLDAAEDRTLTLATEPTHQSLRRSLGPAAILGSVVLGTGWITRFSDEPDAEASPLAALRAVGLRVDVAPAPRVRLRLLAESASGSAPIARFVEGLRDELGPELERLFGAPLARRATVTVDADAVDVALTLSDAEAERALSALVALTLAR
jgi:hypothetical protein